MSVEIVKTPEEMRARADAWRAAGKRIAFVPTMGYLHQGHVSLLDEGRKRGDVLVLSIFVNPTQFGPKEDLSRYPRDLEGDLAKAERAGVDVAYVPDAASMYPDGYQTFVEVEELQKGLCGASRPGHFRGVATVVLKLFHAVQPHVALFGRKDYQQLRVLSRMAHDLDLGVEVVGMPIVREPDGLAMSSRNGYLTPDERAIAPALYRVLTLCAQKIAQGRSIAAISAEGREAIERAGFVLDYIEARHAETLMPVKSIEDGPVRLLVAAKLGKTRLIDNVKVAPRSS